MNPRRWLAHLPLRPHRGPGDGSPFHASGSRGLALCLHGFSGTPFEVRPAAVALARAGFTVSAPVLAGHDADAPALAKSRWQDWLASAETALVRLRATSPGTPVAILGFSTGGLLALHLAATHGQGISALALVSTPLRLRRRQATAIRWLGKLPGFVSGSPAGYVPKLRGSDVSDPDARRDNPCLSVMPLSALSSLLELMETVRPLLPAVTTPTLIAHGMRDRTVPFDDSLEIAGCLGSAVIERAWLERTGHLALIDVEKHLLIPRIVSFLERHAHGTAGLQSRA